MKGEEIYILTQWDTLIQEKKWASTILREWECGKEGRKREEEIMSQVIVRRLIAWSYSRLRVWERFTVRSLKANSWYNSSGIA